MSEQEMIYPRAPFLVVGLSPTFQNTMVFEQFRTGEVNRAELLYRDVAGKGLNVARVLTQLGEESVHLTYVGGDDASRYTQMADSAGLVMKTVAGGSGIRTCVTVVDLAEPSTTELIEPTPPVDNGTEERIVEEFTRLLAAAGTVVLTGTTAPGFSVDLYSRLTAVARERGTYVCVDYRGDALKKTLENNANTLPNLIKINMAEFAQTFFHRAPVVLESEDSGDEELLAKAHNHFSSLRSRGIEVVVTRGARSTIYMDSNGALKQYDPIPMKALNTIGCGDAFTAGLLSELSGGSGSIEEAIERAHTVAGMNASLVRPGTIVDTD